MLKKLSQLRVYATKQNAFIALGLMVIALIISMIVVAFYYMPPTHLLINQQGLSEGQYQQLSEKVFLPSKTSFFAADLQALRDQALSLSWVDEVSVKRDWEKGIIVTVLPKQAVANFGSTHLLDTKGVVFVPAQANELMQKNLVNLYGDPKQSSVIMHKMEQINEWYAPLSLQVQDIILTPRMTWFIRFNNGLSVVVDNEDTTQKLLNLEQVLSHQLKNRLGEMNLIDLRYKNGFAIAWKRTKN